MKTLVTGASGFIGKHLIKKLIKRRDKINVLVRKKEKLDDSTISIFHGDIFNNTILKKGMDDVEVVFHLAAKTHDFSKNKNSYADYYKINVEGTRNLLNACIGSKIKHFIYFSSIKSMAEESEKTLDEDFTPTPATPYGETKLAAERLVTSYGTEYGFKTTSLRLPLVYGPGNLGNIYKMIEAIDMNRFIMMGRGDNRRSMVYVGNVVDAALAVVGLEEANGKTYIVTDADDYSVRELYKIIAKALKKKPMEFYVPMNLAKGLACIGDCGSYIIRRQLPFNSETLEKLTNSLTFSSQKIQREINFKPKYNLYTAINKTISWYEGRKQLES